MNDPRPATILATLDAYRADAAERAELIRTLEKSNRVLATENALAMKQLLLARDTESFAFAWGILAGACLLGCAAAIDDGRRDATVVWGSLSLLFVGVRVIWRHHATSLGK